ncbi:MAG: ATP-binding protein [Moorellaceae bacterium]
MNEFTVTGVYTGKKRCAVQGFLELSFKVQGRDFQAAGDGASKLKHVLQQVGFPPELVRRVAIAAFEAEMNIVIHAYHGELRITISPERIVVTAEDEGPGIPDIELAMQEGFSTAPPEVREMGFGAGMGLPNIKRCADRLEIRSVVGRGTLLRAEFYHRSPAD